MLPANGSSCDTDHILAFVYDFLPSLSACNPNPSIQLLVKHSHIAVADFQGTDTPLSELAKHSQRISWNASSPQGSAVDLLDLSFEAILQEKVFVWRKYLDATTFLGFGSGCHFRNRRKTSSPAPGLYIS
jgi:hypothetical protein